MPRPKRIGSVLGHPGQRKGSRPVLRIVDRTIRCRYCGNVSVYGVDDQICHRCEKIRTSWETKVMSQFSIADRRGWGVPTSVAPEQRRRYASALFAPEQLLLKIQKQLRERDIARARENERTTKKARKAKNASQGRLPTARSESGESGTEERLFSSFSEADPISENRPGRRVA